MNGPGWPTSTLAGTDHGRSHVAVWGRRLFLSALALVVVAGAGNLLGVREASSEASAGGYELSVRYAAVSRAGLDVPFEITVRHEGGFGEELQLRITGAYFDLFETQGFAPEPSDSTRDARDLTLTFAAPDGEVFRVAYDAYVQPAAQRGDDARVSVVDSGRVVASVELNSVVLP